jgi:fermentation-respiration switch protein FrsA (DUF1100 family)
MDVLVLTRIVGAFVVLVGAMGCSSLRPPGLAALEQKLLYQPTKYPEGEWAPDGLVKEDVWFESDGLRLHGWYCPVVNPRAVVLFAHGNAGNVSHRADKLRLFSERLGVTIMGFDYRGYGRSEGEPSEAGLIADARAARAFLARKTGVPEGAIVLYGQSLGGAVMVDLASADGAGGLILESTFTSLRDVANYNFPLTPPGRLLQNKFDSLAKMPAYRGPALMAHGEEDTLVPIKQAEALFAAANEPKWFVRVPGAEHNWKPTLLYVSALDQFFTQFEDKPTELLQSLP